jgi:membrane-bound lytic murein transglycosylase D
MMTGLKKSSCWIALLGLIGIVLGCAPVRTSSLRNQFVAPIRPGAVVVTPDPPVIAAAANIGDTPRFLSPPPAISRTSSADALIHEADWHYQSGRKLYEQGDEPGARREFDRAVDVLLAAPESATLRPAVDGKLDDLVDRIHRLDLAGLGSADTASEPVFEKPPLEDIPELTFPVDPKLKDKVAEELKATVSQLPLQVTDAVLSYIDYFSTDRGRKMLLSGLRRGGRYRPLIQRIFDEEGVPSELIYLAQAESGFLPRAVSRRRASGMWQFMQQRGREYGLVQSPYSDDRFDPEKSTRAAARHLSELYRRYGDWYLAMAAYNCGPGVIDRAVERTGYADYWELRRLNVLPRDTANYVPVILAMTIMVKNGKEYGLEKLETDPAIEYDTVEIGAPTHLELIADAAECPVSQIRDLNPALLKDVAPGAWSLRVPKGTGSAVASILEAVPAQNRTEWRAHRAAGAEPLSSIARRYRVTESSIVAANRLAGAAIEPGAMLVIPAAAVRHVQAKRASHKHSAQRIASRKGGSGGRTATASAHRTGKPVTYTAANITAAHTKQAAVKR